MNTRDEGGRTHAPGLLTVDLGALRRNYACLRAQSAPAACAGVVKADGYGLGIAAVAPALWAAGCRTFFVALLDEGIELRRILPDAEILVLNGLGPREETEFRAYRLLPVLNDLGQVRRWAKHCAEGGPLPAALHVDTGMSRLGLPPEETAVLACSPAITAGWPLRLIMSHLACADVPEDPLNAVQLEAFRLALRQLPAAPAGLAASSGIFLGPEYRFDLVRPGVSLYGGAPAGLEANPMSPVVRLQSRVLQVRTIPAGRAIGYGATHRANRALRVATVAAGYADGYLRSLGNRGIVHVGGARAQVLGRVSMDLITIDVSDHPSVEPGAVVDLICPEHPIDALASEAGTIAYEILTSLGGRYRRHYVGVT